MARYSGRQSTIEAYKKERERVMKVIGRLRASGVDVPSSMIPHQGGHVTMKEVHALERRTRESILKKSTITVMEQKPTGKGKQAVTYRGSDVAKVVKREQTKQKRKVREGIKAGKYKRIPEAGIVVDEKGRTVARTKKKKRKTEIPLPPKPPYNPIEDDYESDIIEQDEDEYIPNPVEKINVNRWFIDTVMEGLSPYRRPDDMSRAELPKKFRDQAARAESIATYFEEALIKYGEEAVASVLMEMSKLNFPPFYLVTYDETVYDRFIAHLSKGLPMPGRKEFDINNNDYDEDEYNEEDEYE